MIGLALGKHGAGELNYSSDIDPILLFDRERLARRASDDPGEAAQRYARRVVALLALILMPPLALAAYLLAVLVMPPRYELKRWLD